MNEIVNSAETIRRAIDARDRIMFTKVDADDGDDSHIADLAAQTGAACEFCYI